ncbi:MAG: DUF305 domain-containing protein [Candidatus Saccharimonadales bacterium]
MSKKTIIIIVATLIVVAGVSVFALRDTLFQSYASTDSPQPGMMSNTKNEYAELKGEAYDKAFLANMIAHHQGAVDMAKLAQTNAKHAELKSMADDIVSAQEAEIAEMTEWQSSWGYPSTSADNMQDHSAMGMMDEMSGMMTALEGKTGDEFDKAFLEQMIMHHQSAIDMAAPADTNASRQEVKTLASEIVAAQTLEIKQMKQWQSDWGY